MLLKNGYLIDTKNQISERLDLRITDGRVEEIGKGLEIKDKEEILDVRDCWVMPGAIDLHVHFREPGYVHKETIETGAKSAAKGGFTTVCAMPNTNPIVDNKDIVEKIYTIVNEKAIVNVLQIGAITKEQKGKQLADIEEMQESGICAISEDGRSVMNPELLRKAMKIAKDIDLPIFSHCEDETIAEGCMHEGIQSAKLGLKGIPREAEDSITQRDILLAKETKAQLHLCHVSTKGSVEYVRKAKENGIKVTAEVCPHHFTLTDKVVDGINTNTKMNPPLRGQEDYEAILEGFRDGTIDVIATDHAPHHEDEKNTSYEKAPNGIIGLETAIPLGITELVNKGIITKEAFVEKLTANPAKILGSNRGGLAVKDIADITIIDPTEIYKIEDDFASMSKNTPFIGREVQGRVKYTIVSGKIVYQHENR